MLESTRCHLVGKQLAPLAGGAGKGKDAEKTVNIDKVDHTIIVKLQIVHYISLSL